MILSKSLEYMIKAILPQRLKYVIKAIHRKHAARPDSDGLEVICVSPGGVGTTFLMEYLSSFVRVNHLYDGDGLKHWLKPPEGEALADAPQMIFVSGSPDQIVASIARRDWILPQSAKLGCITGTIFKGGAQRKAFRRAVEMQISAWKGCKSDKLLIVEYNDLWDRAAEIARHAGIDEATFVASFPERKKRKST